MHDKIFALSLGQPDKQFFRNKGMKNILIIAFPTEIRLFNCVINKSNVEINDLEVSISTNLEIV